MSQWHETSWWHIQRTKTPASSIRSWAPLTAWVICMRCKQGLLECKGYRACSKSMDRCGFSKFRKIKMTGEEARRRWKKRGWWCQRDVCRGMSRCRRNLEVSSAPCRLNINSKWNLEQNQWQEQTSTSKDSSSPLPNSIATSLPTAALCLPRNQNIYNLVPKAQLCQ